MLRQEGAFIGVFVGLCALYGVSLRVVVPGVTSVIDGVEFRGFGAHVEGYATPYFTAAASLGLTTAVRARAVRPWRCVVFA